MSPAQPLTRRQGSVSPLLASTPPSGYTLRATPLAVLPFSPGSINAEKIPAPSKVARARARTVFVPNRTTARLPLLYGQAGADLRDDNDDDNEAGAKRLVRKDSLISLSSMIETGTVVLRKQMSLRRIPSFNSLSTRREQEHPPSQSAPTSPTDHNTRPRGMLHTQKSLGDLHSKALPLPPPPPPSPIRSKFQIMTPPPSKKRKRSLPLGGFWHEPGGTWEGRWNIGSLSEVAAGLRELKKDV